MDKNQDSRRGFIEKSIRYAALTGIAGASILSGCKDKNDEGQKVSPPEDLMQEHGLLNRVLLIYDACRAHLVNNENFPIGSLSEAAGVIRNFEGDLVLI